ncbi:hypothetical protein [Streptomyces cupreus]|nr:hypothetical protein [Streptomyces cupreus]
MVGPAATELVVADDRAPALIGERRGGAPAFLRDLVVLAREVASA